MLNSTSSLKKEDGFGFGATEAARGSLAHWIEIKDGVIKNYQVMAPTTWNVGPNDEQGKSGPIEAALTGIEIEDPHDPVEVGMVRFSSTPAWFAPYTHTMAKRARNWLSCETLVFDFNGIHERPQFLLKIVGVFMRL